MEGIVNKPNYIEFQQVRFSDDQIETQIYKQQQKRQNKKKTDSE